jgi:hypothetical protein
MLPRERYTETGAVSRRIATTAGVSPDLIITLVTLLIQAAAACLDRPEDVVDWLDAKDSPWGTKWAIRYFRATLVWRRARDTWVKIGGPVSASRGVADAVLGEADGGGVHKIAGLYLEAGYIR